MNYIDALITDYPLLDPCRQEILNAHELLTGCINGGGKIFVCGNGGSAADAEHIVGELMKGFRLKRKLTPGQIRKIAEIFPEEYEFISQNLQQAIPAISLVGSVSLATAFANDVNPDFIFAQQLYGLGNPGDALIAISTSGNSVNVLNAAKAAKIRGMNIIGLTGCDGGLLKNLCTVSIGVPAADVAKIQELHLPVYHCLCSMLEQFLFDK